MPCLTNNGQHKGHGARIEPPRLTPIRSAAILESNNSSGKRVLAKHFIPKENHSCLRIDSPGLTGLSGRAGATVRMLAKIRTGRGAKPGKTNKAYTSRLCSPFSPKSSQSINKAINI